MSQSRFVTPNKQNTPTKMGQQKKVTQDDEQTNNAHLEDKNRKIIQIYVNNISGK
jgi:hypothetical protein